MKKRTFKFLLGGGISALFNLFLIYIMIEQMEFNTPTLRNIANIIAIELSLIFSFFIYRMWVWTGGNWKISEVLGKQLPLYHFAAGSAVATRIFIMFPLLDWIGISYSVNTLIGILLSATLNYVINISFSLFSCKNSEP